MQQLEAENQQAVREGKPPREASEAEKETLVRYSGWGALAQLFEERGSYRRTPQWHAQWGALAAELEALLPPGSEEYKKARATTPNAHYTSPMVTQAIWDGLQRLGVKGEAEVLEPSMGVGHFFGLMPQALEGGHRTGVELDLITARIARYLYPDATIFAQGFETLNDHRVATKRRKRKQDGEPQHMLLDNYFDVVVGNPPFGDYGVDDPSIPENLRRSIHDYFFVNALHKLRPGGIMAFVTSRYTMDKEDATVREYLADHADLLGAIRLPNTAFKDNAGTQVVTDILFLRKRLPEEKPAGQSWTKTCTVHINGQPVALNEYYDPDPEHNRLPADRRHPEMLLGTLTLGRGMYRDNEPIFTGELAPERLHTAIEALPEGVYTPRDQGRSPPRAAPLVAPEAFVGIKDGGYALIEGRIAIREGQRFEFPEHLTANTAARIRGLIEIRRALARVFETQLKDEPEDHIIAARLALNQAYDQFIEAGHGPISSPANVKAFLGDPDYPLLTSLERYDPDTNTATKGPAFERRTLAYRKPVEQAETAADALAVSLNDFADINWQRMTGLTGSSPRALQAELSGQVFQDPEQGGKWVIASKYKSGNVRRKLEAATAAAEINPAYRPNVDALKAVQPEPLLPSEIHTRLGMSWIPASDIQDFICDLLKLPPIYKREVSVTHADVLALWDVRLSFAATSQATVANTTTHGTLRAPAHSLIDDALNMRTPTAYDHLADGTSVVNQSETVAAREALQKIQDSFGEWLWKDPERAARLAAHYNELFNNSQPEHFDGSHLTLPGMDRSWLRNSKPDQHQLDAIWRCISERNVLLGHCVGAGKTLTITAACMELKRLGVAQKPMIVVPNHLVDQWGAAFLQLYPQANIFVAGKEHFTKGNREKAMARIATGTYDAVIISSESFKSLSVSDETYKRFCDKEIAVLREAIYEVRQEKGNNRSIIKQLEKAQKRLEVKIAERAKREQKDDGVTFEQLGIDRIFVDEAHLYKNLGPTGKVMSSRIAGLPSTQSDRALDMFMKTQYLAERDGGVVFATGTPISNSLAEMYILMRYLAPELLEAAGVAHFDAWVANFAEVVTALELAPDGSGYRMNSRFAKFTNLADLMKMFLSFADIQTADMLNLPRPQLAGDKPEVISAAASPELKAFISLLSARADKVRARQVSPSVDNMLKITTEGRLAALDMRLIDPDAEPGPNTKLYKAINNIFNIWQRTTAQRSTQLVFCDLSTPKPLTFDAPAHIEAFMTLHGQSPEKIRFVLDAIGPASRLNTRSEIETKLRAHGGFTDKGIALILDAVAQGRNFNVYDEIKATLIAQGVPAKEIAFIHDYDTDAKKKRLYNDVNAGRIRILIGSTEKMGAGTNVQEKLIAEHHLDAPWRPSDVEQRDGRILRPGNENEVVSIYRYVTESSFDAYMWQTLETKIRFILQVMRGDLSLREAEDLENGALPYAVVKAIASGNPAVMEEALLDAEIQKLEALRTAHRKKQDIARKQVAGLPKDIEKSEGYYTGLLEDITRRNTATGEEFTITVGNRVISGKGTAREEAGKAITQAVMASIWEDSREASLKHIGQYRGFTVMSSYSGREGETPKLYLRGKNTYGVNLNLENPAGTIGSMDAVLRLLDKDAEQEKAQMERDRNALQEYLTELEKPFEKQERLEDLRNRQKEIRNQLDLNNKNDHQAVMAQAAEEERAALPEINGLDRALEQVNADDELLKVKAMLQPEQVEVMWAEERDKVPEEWQARWEHAPLETASAAVALVQKSRAI